jgi:hypothetical protein
MNRIVLLVLACTLVSAVAFSQSEEQRQIIIKDYDLNKLKEIERKFSLNFELTYARALELAELNGWQIKIIKDDGSIWELYDVTDDNLPLYIATENEGGAQTTRTTSLYPGGSLGLNLTGNGMTLGLWEVDATLPAHELFEGRVTQIDNDALSNHASHVAGTIVGGDNIQGGARGMAYEAEIRAFNTTNDEAEMASEAGAGMLISSHSYGIPGTAVPTYYLGKYDNNARDVDEIMYNAPFYLGVFSAGNDRNDGINVTGYDLLTDKSCNKNGLTVAAVQEVTNYTGPNSVNMSSFSSWGPTDDGRIKPDICAKGIGMYSASSSGTSNYFTANGTSMATPNVSGSLLLIQQHYFNEFGAFMRSSTLRGLALHTADEAGNNPGPDYEFGWGLLNAERAATVISNEGETTMISEITLNNGEQFTIDVYASNVEDLMASITWTDPEGTVGPNVVNDPTPNLVHDLDLRVTQNTTTYYPWKLDLNNPSNGATQDDNSVDNIEKVEVNGSSGLYTITVSHKGTLTSPQVFSLIVTGLGDCTGESGGTAYIDSCGTCVEGTTGLNPCDQDCYGEWGGTASLDSCGICVEGSTGLTPCTQDCFGEWGGTAYVDSCGTCAEGTTGVDACAQDCFGEWGGAAFIDSCGFCAGGNSGFAPILDLSLCGASLESFSSDLIEIYPNPSSGLITIDFKATEGISELLVLTVDGKVVYTLNNPSENTIELDLQHLEDGMYLLQLNGKDLNLVNRIVISN